MIEKPKFKHDCESCVFLGRFEGADLYYCAGQRTETIVARFSSEGADYTSGLCFGKKRINRHLAQAYDLAVCQGWLIDRDDKIDSIPTKALNPGYVQEEQ